MATTILIYRQERSLFLKGQFKPFVNKYFKDVLFLGFECGRYGAHLQVSNWDEIKDTLPKSYKPLEVKPC